MLEKKTILLGVSGSIAAYKIAGLASMLVKQKADVHVIMTRNATNFIHPISFETLTSNKCLVDTFDRNFQFNVEHVALAKKADLFMVAPASADVIGKIASGIADDMLTTTIMATEAPKLLAPAMNTRMFMNPIVQDNLKKLADYGYGIISPAEGYLACGDSGAGKMPEASVLFDYIQREIGADHDLLGRKILVTAGPTREAIDPVRFISNYSTGKMGYAIARAAMLRGARVTLVSGPVEIAPPPFVKRISVSSAAEMAEEVIRLAPRMDAIIKAAAVADYRPAAVAGEKIKKQEGETSIALERTQDILRYLGEHKREGQFLCGFAMETQNLLENARDKLERKKVDLIVANSLRTAGAGFGTDTNVVTLIDHKGQRELPLLTKAQVADAILDYMKECGVWIL